MRVNQNISSQNELYYIQRARTQMDKLGEQLASGQRVNRPSDDPVAARLLLGLADRLTSSDQYSSNISKAGTWFQMANTALTTMSDTLLDIRSKVSTIGGGMSTEQDRNNAVSYLEMMKKTLVDVGNTDINGVYIFAGTNNLKPPFAARTGDIAAGSTVVTNVTGDVSTFVAGMEFSGPGIAAGTKLADPPINAGSPPSLNLTIAATATNNGVGFSVYGGNESDISVEINKNVSEAINIPGNQILMSTGAGPYGSVDILGTIDQLIVDLKSNNITGISNGVKALDKGYAQVNSAQTEIQTRMVRFDAAEKMHQNINNTVKTVMGNEQAVDYAQLAVELQLQQTAYQATLSTTSKILQMSLLDYL